MAPSASATHRILVVEDDVDSAESLALLLTMAGHAVRVVHDGHSALRVAREFRPAVLLSDLGLPDGLSGHELAAAVKRDAELSGVFCIALTGRGGIQDERQAREAGFDAFLSKPVTWNVLESTLRSVPLKS